jgi:hypothetical protein
LLVAQHEQYNAHTVRGQAGSFTSGAGVHIATSTREQGRVRPYLSAPASRHGRQCGHMRRCPVPRLTERRTRVCGGTTWWAGATGDDNPRMQADMMGRRLAPPRPGDGG